MLKCLKASTENFWMFYVKTYKKALHPVAAANVKAGELKSNTDLLTSFKAPNT